MSTAAMWTSKLGNKYPMAWMQENDRASQQELKRLRSLAANSTCADCGRQDNSWASVTHGVFICMICSDVHRSVGTHITKVKGCTGTYLWGPDELERMQAVAKEGADNKYGARKIEPEVSKEQKQRYVVEKYEKLSFVTARSSSTHRGDDKAGIELVKTEADKPKLVAHQPQLTVRKADPKAAPTPQQAAKHCVQKSAAAPMACAAEISDSWFDDFFKDESCVQKSAIDAPAMKPIQQTTSKTDCGLDAFLDATLQLAVKPSPVTVSAYPAHLDPFHKAQPAPVADPFFDWPEF